MTQSMSSLLSRLNSSRSQRKPPERSSVEWRNPRRSDRGLHPRIGASAGAAPDTSPRSRRGAASLPRAGLQQWPMSARTPSGVDGPVQRQGLLGVVDEVAVHEIVASTLARSAQGGWLDLDQSCAPGREVRACPPYRPERRLGRRSGGHRRVDGLSRRAESAFGRTGPQVEAGGVALGLEVQIRCAMRTRAMARRLGRKWMAWYSNRWWHPTGGDRRTRIRSGLRTVVMWSRWRHDRNCW